MASLLPNPPVIADPLADESSVLIAWSITMFVLSGTAVPMRFLSLWLIRSHRSNFNRSDWLALAALPLVWAMDLVVIYGVLHNGYGKHIGASTLDQLQSYLLSLWVFEILYCAAITLAKLSLVALWWSIFKHSTGSYVALIFIGTAAAMWFVGAALAIIFSCVPVSGFWTISEPSQCLDRSNAWIGAAVPNIILDLILLVLPNFWIRKLNVSKSQRLGLVFIFTLGIFVTISSALRLWQLIITADETAFDPQFATVSTGIWSLVEANLAVVCACLPTMKPLLRLVVTGRVKSSYGYLTSGRRSNTPGDWNDMNKITDVKVHRLQSPIEPRKELLTSPAAHNRLDSKHELPIALKPLPPVKVKISMRGVPSKSRQVLAPKRNPHFGLMQQDTDKPSHAARLPNSELQNNSRFDIWSYGRPPSDWNHAGEHSWLRLVDSRPVSTVASTPRRRSYDGSSLPPTPPLPSLHSRSASWTASGPDLDDFHFHLYHES